MARSLATRFEKKIRKSDSCWIWIAATSKFGYGRFLFNGKNTAAHRVAWTIYRGEIPKGMFVLHKCDVRNCVNPDHLFLGTQDDNMKDCAKKGRFKSRPKYYNLRKLTSDKVAEIIRLKSESGLSISEISKIVGISRTRAYGVISQPHKWSKYGYHGNTAIHAQKESGDK
jgi:hypothetical protein